ncbi:hypothetical protein [Methylocella sp.]|uniref:hypothetical protein n=1 Tax=Methylocella sp. TaxID=1978226 RepID=UPI003784DF51
MAKIALIAFLPTSAVLFGLMSLFVAMNPQATHNFDWAFGLYMTIALASMILAAPVSWLVARRMMTRRDKRIVDAQAARPTGAPGA